MVAYVSTYPCLGTWTGEAGGGWVFGERRLSIQKAVKLSGSSPEALGQGFNDYRKIN